MCKHDTTDIVSASKGDTTHIVNPTVNLIDSICYTEVVEPLLLANCSRSGCHNDTTRQKGISVASYHSLISSISGELLLKCIKDTGELRMPPDPSPHLTDTQIAVIQQWVKEGMKFNIDCMGPCDTSKITYSITIKNIMKNSCNGCHCSSTPILLSYDSVHYYVNNGKFLGSIMHTGSCLPMPDKLPKLPECQIKQIKKWVDAGAPNN